MAAIRDGYAVRAADLSQLPATLDVIAEIKAGASNKDIPVLQPGQAATIMTGATAPPGADAVVMVEHTTHQGKRVQITKGVAAGDNIAPVGSEAKRGERLLSPGLRLDYPAIAVAAATGRSRLLVYRKPQIGVLATGDPSRLRELIADGLEADLLLLAGGVSMGKYDLVEQVLAEFQAEFFFTGVQIQPGKPVVFGRVPCGTPARGQPASSASYTYFFGLPGNPVSTMVTFELFARPMLEALAGLTPRKLVFLNARLKSEIKTKTGLKRFLPAVLSGEFEHAEIELARWQGSGDVAAMTRANCYIVISLDRDRIAAGEWVPVLMR